ncbi:MAG: response regulator [candidate division Zixibacteria bacterium]|nr:response regulator [candidate division Zixibacteria bacterium]
MKNSVSVLVVDDEAGVRSVLEQILQLKGYHVHGVGSGREALEYLKTYAVDLVLSDIVMPEISGLELLQVIKKQLPHVGVVIMTGHGDAYTVKQALSLGADEYITKPFRGDEVALIIERVHWRFVVQKKDNLPAPPSK